MAAHSKAGIASKILGVSKTQLRRLAEERQLPDGSVIATPGGHFFYNVEVVKDWMLENYRRQTRLPKP